MADVVGFIGTGRMGLPMCQRLLEAPHRLAVHTRTRARAEPLLAAGATWCEDAAALAAAAPVVITCLDTVEATEALYLGERGLVKTARPGALLIDHATITPDLARRISAAAAAGSVDFVDAPVSGGPEGARLGTLAIMMGGTEDAVARATAVARAYGGTLLRMGPVGAGTHAKLVNQLLTFVHGAAAAEALALAERLGLDLGALGTLLAQSFGHSRMLDRTLQRVRAGEWQAGAALSLYDKDLGIVAGVAHEAGMSVPVASALHEWLREALARGLGERDIAALRLMYPRS